MASERARIVCTSFRDPDELIHFDSPVTAAIRPSKLTASFRCTHGRPVVIQQRKPRIKSSHCGLNMPVSTHTPARFRLRMPRPSTIGLGSREPTTTRRNPASRSALVHGGVSP
jgi:hypothetical protein